MYVMYDCSSLHLSPSEEMAQLLGLVKPWKIKRKVSSLSCPGPFPQVSLSARILFSPSSPVAGISLVLPKASTGRLWALSGCLT